MTARFLLDTNIVIFALRNRTPALRERLTEHFGRMAVSVVTVAELQYGIDPSGDPMRNRRATDEFLSLVDVQPLSADYGHLFQDRDDGLIQDHLAGAGVL